jgi:hypothetical protein
MGEIDRPVLRALSVMMTRMRSMGATMFGGKRDFYEALGYNQTIDLPAIRTRYDRGDIAGRIVDAYPKSTWGGVAEIIEVEDPDTLTTFEKACRALMSQVKMWSVFKRADILAGLGKYSVILIGAPGPDLTQELPRGKPGQVVYLTPYGEATASIATQEEDERNPRYGQPLLYELTSQSATKTAKAIVRKVHWTRVIHIADNILDNDLAGTSRLEKVWNRLDDLDKIVGGGSEAFWKAVYQGMQIDVDKDMDLDDPSLTELKAQIDEFEHNMRRTMRTRGVKVTTLGADTSDFSNNAGTVLDLISGACEVPQRILLGSERGELASTQDRENWHDRVNNRRTDWAEPYVVRPFIDRLIEYGYLPRPKEDYWVVWPKLGLNMTETSLIVERLSKVNTQMGETVITGDDVRDKVLGWDLLDPADVHAIPLPESDEADVPNEAEAGTPPAEDAA